MNSTMETEAMTTPSQAAVAATARYIVATDGQEATVFDLTRGKDLFPTTTGNRRYALLAGGCTHETASLIADALNSADQATDRAGWQGLTEAFAPLADKARAYDPDVFGAPVGDRHIVMVELGHLRKCRAIISPPSAPSPTKPI